MVRNVETRWISMRSPAQQILAKYKPLLFKMGVDMTSSLGHKVVAGSANNFDSLSDVEVSLSLACFIPLVNLVYSLMKKPQARNIFVCNFLQAVKVCQSEFARLFIDGTTAYNKDDFPNFCDIVGMQGTNIPTRWKVVPQDSEVCHLIFELNAHNVYAWAYDNLTGKHIFVTHVDFYRV